MGSEIFCQSVFIIKKQAFCQAYKGTIFLPRKIENFLRKMSSKTLFWGTKQSSLYYI
ncbi:hypothetical protein amyaer_0530 [Microcystis aeruginosa NIES-2481]|nr:hypothetical protein amyaer_0530 [Microcystis aeruginosa NIES-2481]